MRSTLIRDLALGLTIGTAGFVLTLAGSGVANGSPAFWYLSRTSGIVAYLMFWGSVAWGLMISTGMGRAWVRPAVLMEAHQFLSSAAIGFAAFHGLVLIGDATVPFSVADVLVPFVGTHKPVLVALGQLGGWMALLIVVSFHARRRIGAQVWRRLHTAAFAAYWMVLAHGAWLGSDRNTLWLNAVYAVTSGTVVFLFSCRVLMALMTPKVGHALNAPAGGQ